MSILDWFKPRWKHTRNEMSAQIMRDYGSIKNAVNTQIRLLVFFDKMNPKQFLDDAFFRLYAFGAFDSATSRYGFEIRKKIGPSLLELGYVGYISNAFNISKQEAEKYLQEGFSALSETPVNQALMQGGTDGVQVLQGGQAKGLLVHHRYNFDENVPGNVVAEFKKYCERANPF